MVGIKASGSISESIGIVISGEIIENQKSA